MHIFLIVISFSGDFSQSFEPDRNSTFGDQLYWTGNILNFSNLRERFPNKFLDKLGNLIKGEVFSTIMDFSFLEPDV